jgi:non-ribosomal peptide synthase protein (TIGR01720 family)
VAKQVQASLDITHGPLLRVAFFKLGAQKMSRLLIVIHHLAVDAVSWRILLDDLQTACRQIGQGLLCNLPPKTTSFKYWAERVSEYAQSDVVAREMEYWTSKERGNTTHLFVDYPKGINTLESAGSVRVSLTKRETQVLLQQTLKSFRTEVNNVLLTALWQSFKDRSGSRRLLVDLRGHGREQLFDDLNLSRTVGWFTSVFPILSDVQETCSAKQALESVGEQLRSLPNRGIGYGHLRYLNEKTRMRLRGLPQAPIAFNYLGQLDQLFSESAILVPIREMSGLARDGRATRPYLLELSASVIDGQLNVAWTYSKNLHRRETIESLAGASSRPWAV